MGTDFLSGLTGLLYQLNVITSCLGKCLSPGCEAKGWLHECRFQKIFFYGWEKTRSAKYAKREQLREASKFRATDICTGLVSAGSNFDTLLLMRKKLGQSYGQFQDYSRFPYIDCRCRGVIYRGRLLQGIPPTPTLSLSATFLQKVFACLQPFAQAVCNLQGGGGIWESARTKFSSPPFCVCSFGEVHLTSVKIMTFAKAAPMK